LLPFRPFSRISAMIADLNFLQRRDFDDDDCYYSHYDCYSPWYAWGRWVALAGIVLIFLLLLCCCAFITSRRRRRVGVQPYYGTAWMAPPKYAPGNDVHQFQNYPPQHHGGPPGPYAQYYAPTPAPPYQQTTGTHVGGGQPVAPATYAATPPPPTEYPAGSAVQTHATGGSNPNYPPTPNPPAAAHVTDAKV